MSDKIRSANCFHTRFMVPGWWVNAYEASIFGFLSADHLNPVEVSLRSGLTPALDITELNAVGVLLSSVQSQLVTGSRSICLDPSSHRKFLSSGGRSRAFTFERALQTLSGLKLLVKSNGDIWDTVPIFSKEVWFHENAGVQVQLELTEWGAELLFGYRDPWSELLRLKDDKPVLKGLYGNHAPLALWKAAWLDLQGPEQALLLRIEKAMQWDFKWLRLDGVFGVELHELFDNLELGPARGKFGELSPFTHKLRILAKLGRKLSDHGLLTFIEQKDYLAVSSNDSSMALLWQGTDLGTSSDDHKAYSRLAAQYLWNHQYSQVVDKVIRLCLGPDKDDFNEVRAVWSEIRKYKESAEIVCFLDPITPLVYGAIFIEWMIRIKTGHKLRIPDDWIESDAIKLLRSNYGRNCGNCFKEFVELVSSDHKYIYFLKKVEGGSILSDVTAKSQRMKKFLKMTSKSITVSVPQVEVKQVQDKKGSLKVNPIHAKKIAGEQLLKIRQSDPAKYSQLKSQYIKTLDLGRKKVIEEIQEKMQPHVFDDHLKHSLIKFMVENPQAWQKIPIEASI